MEILEGVNLKLGAWAIVVVIELILIVLPAVATTVALCKETILVGLVAGVRGSLVGPLVCLHDVKFRAVVTTDLICIAVVHLVVTRV